jgi:hypothetical protein
VQKNLQETLIHQWLLGQQHHFVVALVADFAAVEAAYG